VTLETVKTKKIGMAANETGPLIKKGPQRIQSTHEKGRQIRKGETNPPIMSKLRGKANHLQEGLGQSGKILERGHLNRHAGAMILLKVMVTNPGERNNLQAGIGTFPRVTNSAVRDETGLLPDTVVGQRVWIMSLRLSLTDLPAERKSPDPEVQGRPGQTTNPETAVTQGPERAQGIVAVGPRTAHKRDLGQGLEIGRTGTGRTGTGRTGTGRTGTGPGIARSKKHPTGPKRKGLEIGQGIAKKRELENVRGTAKRKDPGRVQGTAGNARAREIAGMKAELVRGQEIAGRSMSLGPEARAGLQVT